MMTATEDSDAVKIDKGATESDEAKMYFEPESNQNDS